MARSRNAARIKGVQRLLVGELAKRLDINVSEIDPRLPFASYGLDSLISIELATELEQLVGCRLPVTMFWDYPSIDSLAKYLVDDIGVDSAS